jgi:hypothetical protein
VIFAPFLCGKKRRGYLFEKQFCTIVNGSSRSPLNLLAILRYAQHLSQKDIAAIGFKDSGLCKKQRLQGAVKFKDLSAAVEMTENIWFCGDKKTE